MVYKTLWCTSFKELKKNQDRFVVARETQEQVKPRDYSLDIDNTIGMLDGHFRLFSKMWKI